MLEGTEPWVLARLPGRCLHYAPVQPAVLLFLFCGQRTDQFFMYMLVSGDEFIFAL